MKRTNFILTVLTILIIAIYLIWRNSTVPATIINLKEVADELIMPGHMPRDFNFSLRYGVGAKSEINTFKDTYTKDLVLDGTVTTDLKLSKDEMKNIYQKMKEIELLSTVQNAKYQGEDGSLISIEPMSDYFLSIQMNGKVYNTHWNSNIYDEETSKKLAKFVNHYLHDQIISNKSEFKNLPEISGGYE